MPNFNPKTSHLTPFSPDSSKGSLDKRKLTVRLYTPQRDEVAALAAKTGLKESEVARALMEYALSRAEDIVFE